MRDNSTSDLTAIGARTPLPGTDPSLNQNDHVTIEMNGDGSRGGEWQPVEGFADSLPASPDYGNSAAVID